MDIAKITVGVDPPYDLNAIIEIPQGGEPVKYELNKESGAMFVDRFLHTAMFYPGNYGFIPHTLSDDGDPCDVLIISEREIMPGAMIAVRPVGVLRMQDEAGGDEKIVAVPVSRITRRYASVHNHTDLPDIVLERIQHFFEHYKDLEPGKWVKVVGWGDAEEAKAMILAALTRNQAKD
jgi:inorganic pyrophosphatase